MERLVLIVEQIEEAKRFILADKLPHYRMALLLLDNAAEILMHRVITDELRDDIEVKRLFELLQASLPPKEVEEYKKKRGFKPVSSKQRKDVERFFNAKVDFLVERNRLKKTIGNVIKALHRYRNEAYHQEKIRKKTISAAAALFFEIDCELLVSLPQGWMSFSREEDWSDFLSRYEIKSSMSLSIWEKKKIAKSLRKGMETELGSLSSLLSDHLNSRVDEIEEQLDFIVKNVTSKMTAENEIIRIQYWKEHRIHLFNESSLAFQRYSAKYSVNDFDKWRKEANLVKEVKEKLEMFEKFCDIEQRIEPLEEMIRERASLVGERIQLGIDMMRGK